MKTFPKPFRLLIAGVTLVVVVALAIIYLNRPVASAETPTVSAEVAVHSAFADATEDQPIGRLVGLPDEIRGQVMMYDQAHLFIFGRPLDRNSLQGNIADTRVWLIIFHGNVIEHVEGAPGRSDIPAQDLPQHQMAIILDAVTADILEGSIIPNSKPLDVQALPLLALPKEPVAGIPTRLPIKTVAPLPTLPAAP